MKLLNGDCMKLLKEIPDGAVDLILCDPPYGTTDCEWDSVLPFDKLWAEYKRVLKVNGVAALFGAQPFTTQLISSNRRDFRYCWYWLKNQATGFTYARYQPMRQIEDIAIFVCNSPNHNNQGKHIALREYMFKELKRSEKTRTDINKILGNQMAGHYFTHGQQFSIPTPENWAKLQAATGCFNRTYEEIQAEYKRELPERVGSYKPANTYNPQGLQVVKDAKPKRRRMPQHDAVYSMDTLMQEFTPRFKNYPKNVLQFSTERGLHPTQKPVPLLEYLVRTYTNEGDTVLDNCMGSGSTGVAVKRVGGRHFIGMEQNKVYYDIAKERIEKEAGQ